ncbi:thioesterase family protein [Lentzea sp. JNUCC 0626]|uniref:thioesterase family protein n=1 Tax=Lentzea sp. JNUCC 0626 TaxID=3367513 RepID=UPI00374993F0
MSDRFAVGAKAVREHVVRSQDCATAWENDLPVLATPVLLWLAEVTSMKVIEDVLAPSEMTVGFQHDNAQHVAATPEGWTVAVTAEVTEVDGRMLTFSVQAHDGVEVVYRGTHVRAVVDREKFLRRFEEKVARS